MTLEDSLREVMAAKVVDPPELPGLYGNVTARAVVVRRRRRVAAAVGSCAAVVAIAVPLALTVGGTSQPKPGGPSVNPSPHTTAHALPVPTRSQPTPPSQTLSASPTTSSATPAGPSYITNSDGLLVLSPPPPPAAPTLSLPVGGVYSAPVMFLDAGALSLQDKGTTYALGHQGTGLGAPVTTKYGILLPGPHSVYLVDDKHQLVTLPGSGAAFACGVVLSPDGRYVAWGTQGGPGGTAGGERTLKGDYVLYDLQSRKVVHRYSANAQGCPMAFTTDGRLLMSLGDGAATDVGFWNPPAASVTLLGKGITTTLWTPLHQQVKVVVRKDESGFCSYYRPGVSGGKAYLGDCGAYLGGPSQDQERLSSALSHDHLAVSDETTLDATHVGVIASAQRKAQGGDFTFTYSWILTCTVPAQGAVSCVQNQQLTPVRTAGSGPDQGVQLGPQAFLVR